jgi:hypothetical protein
LRSKGGTAAKIFNPKALKFIVAASAGIPRRVNVLCHNAMLLAYAEGARQVTLKMAKAAVAEYQDLFTAAIRASSNENPTPRDGLRLSWIPGVTAVAAAAGLLIALMAFGPHFGKWSRHIVIPDSIESRDHTLMSPQSVAVTRASEAESASSSTTPIAVPDYTLSSDGADAALPEAAAAAAPGSASAKSAAKPTAVRLAKQRVTDDEGE